MRITRYKLFLPAILYLVLLSAGCSVNSAIEGHLNEELPLSIGQTMRISEEDLTVEFLAVVEDSRCPKNVTCVWTGRAVVRARITYGDLAQELLLTQPGLTDEYSKEDFQHYQLSYRVLPYPEQGKTISEDEYRLLLVVSK